MNILHHPILTDTQWREQLRIAAEEAQKRREVMVQKRIADSRTLRRIGDRRLADELSKEGRL
jgi:hypothetical protein